MLLDNERVYSTSDDVRRGFMSQENRHYLFYNIGESDDGDGRGGYRSKIRHSLSHDPGELGRLLIFFLLMSMREVEIGLKPASLLHINMVGYTFSTKGYLNKIFQGVW